MGLAVEVGVLSSFKDEDPDGAEWLRECLQKVNKALVRHGLPTHEEPEDLPELPAPRAMGGFPYSFLHHLRRFAAHAWEYPGREPGPFAADAEPAQDAVVEKQTARMVSHLLCHSDAEGFYVPIDFRPILEGDEEDPIPGGVFGSSYRLLEELISVGPRLGVRLEMNDLPEEEAARLAEESNWREHGPLSIERMVWFTLFEAAKASIDHGTAICFM